MDEDQRDQLISEAPFFTAWRRNDAVKAELWFKRIRSLDRLHPVWQARVKIALLCAHKQFAKAIAEFEHGLSLIRQSPDNAQRQRCEAEWIVWKQQIQQRMTVEAA